MIAFNFKIGIRYILKNKVFSAINIVGLALSMACCIVIGLYIWKELGYDQFHKNIGYISRITEQQDQAGNLYTVAVTPGPLGPALERDFPEVARTVRFGQWSGILKNGVHAFEEKNIQLTDNTVFKVFDFPLIKGNPATALSSPNDIVISESLAVKYFGKDWKNNTGILGQVFRLNNQHEFRLAGIAKNVPENSSIQFDVLLPISFLFATDKWSNQWGSNNFHTYIQFKPGTNQPLFEKKIAGQLSKYNADSKDILMLQPLKDQYLKSAFDFKTDWGKRSNIKYIILFSWVGLLLLFIACFNFINLSTARSLKRSLEVGIRKVNGASRKELIFQFLGESTLIAFFAGLFAIIIINIAQPGLESITGTIINTSIFNGVTITLFAAFILIIGLLAGIYPALVLSAFNPARVLKKTGFSGLGKLFRQGLVVVQFAVAVSFIICTLFMYRQLRFIQQKDLGFDKDQIVTIRLGGALKEKSNLFKQDVAKIPGVMAAAAATITLVNVDNSSYLEWEGMKAEDKFLVTQANIDPEFIPTLHLQLLKGTNFSRQLSNDTANYIINESAAARIEHSTDSIIGKQVSFWGAKGKIIGVVKDFHFKPLNAGIEPFIFRYQPQDRYFNLFVKLSGGSSVTTLQQLQKVYKKYEIETPFEFSFLNDAIDRLYTEEKRTAAVILLFSIFTIVIACLGLFGLAVFACEQRVKEIGIRKVLGAGLVSIATLLSKDFLKLVIAGIVVAVPVAWYLTTKWLQNYPYRINMSWSLFIIAGVLVITIAMLTISVQAIKSAKVNPVKNLRTE